MTSTRHISPSVYSWWKPQWWLKALSQISSFHRVLSATVMVYRHESGRCRTLPFFLTFLSFHLSRIFFYIKFLLLNLDSCYIWMKQDLPTKHPQLTVTMRINHQFYRAQLSIKLILTVWVFTYVKNSICSTAQRHTCLHAAPVGHLKPTVCFFCKHKQSSQLIPGTFAAWFIAITATLLTLVLGSWAAGNTTTQHISSSTFKLC